MVEFGEEIGRRRRGAPTGACHRERGSVGERECRNEGKERKDKE